MLGVCQYYRTYPPPPEADIVPFDPDVGVVYDPDISVFSSDGRWLTRMRPTPNLRPSWATLRMVATGLRNRQIGESLGISEGTVKMHLHSIYEKVGLNGRVELSIYAREKALL